MSAAGVLLDAQTTRFERVDPLLPPAAPPPDGDVVTAAMPNGDRVAGMLTHVRYAPGAANTLWSALEMWELFPLLGAAGGDGMDALLWEWRRVLARWQPGPDSACLLAWPSRDAEVAKPLLAHGFVPLTNLAVRTGQDAPPPPRTGTTIRLATTADFEVVLALELAELEYSALVGTVLVRPDMAQVKRATLTQQIEQGDPIWLAERDGIVTGIAHCRVLEVKAGGLTATRLLPGRWGYVNCLSVAEAARGTGVGRDLMAVAHHQLRLRAGTIGTFLHYNPPNPLSSVFWARQGYRPLWTSWELRPATALR